METLKKIALNVFVLCFAGYFFYMVYYINTMGVTRGTEPVSQADRKYFAWAHSIGNPEKLCVIDLRKTEIAGDTEKSYVVAYHSGGEACGTMCTSGIYLVPKDDPSQTEKNEIEEIPQVEAAEKISI